MLDDYWIEDNFVGQLGKDNIGQMANTRIPQVSDVPGVLLPYNDCQKRGG